MASARNRTHKNTIINSDEKLFLAIEQNENILEQIKNLKNKRDLLNNKSMINDVIYNLENKSNKLQNNIKTYDNNIRAASRGNASRGNAIRRNAIRRNTSRRNTSRGNTRRNTRRNNNEHIKFNILNNRSIDNIPKEIRNSMRKDNIDRIIKQYIGFDIINQLIKCREYTENQESYFCAAHSLNNLFGRKIFIHDSKNKSQEYIKLYDYAIKKKILVDVKTGDYEIDIFTIINSTPFLKDYNIDLYNNNDVLFNEGILSDPKLVGFICYSGTHYYVIKKYDNNVFILIDSHNFNGEKKAICIKGDHNSVFTHLDYLQEILGPQGIYRFGIVMHK